MKTDIRTNQQNRAYWLFQEWIATEMNNQGISPSGLIIEIKPNVTAKILHEIFKAPLERMYQIDSTAKMTREQMQKVLDVYLDSLAHIGLNVEFPEESKRNLLQFYS